MRKVVLIGWPVKHSLSPRLHTYWLKQYHIDGEYTAIPVEPKDLATFIADLPKRGFCGCNLTIPHKEAVIPLLDEMDETARSIGAVNVIIVKDGKLRGVNTDAYGFIENLKQHAALEGRKHKAVILGAGGAARAAAKALDGEGFEHIIVANRTLAKAETLATHFGKRFSVVPWEWRSQALEGAGLLANATSLGLAGKEPLEIDLSLLPRDAVVTDAVYVPLMTPLLKAARTRGNIAADGLGMLLHQAVPAFEAWFGVRPEVTPELRKYMMRGL